MSGQFDVEPERLSIRIATHVPEKGLASSMNLRPSRSIAASGDRDHPPP